MAYGLLHLKQDMRKAMTLPPGQVFRRFAGRAVRYARRLRQRHATRGISERELLAALEPPARNLTDFLKSRAEAEPLVPMSRECAGMAGLLKERAAGGPPPRLSPGPAGGPRGFRPPGAGGGGLGGFSPRLQGLQIGKSAGEEGSLL